MANDLQTIIAPVVIRTLTTRYSSPEERDRSSEPFAQLVHTEDAVSLDGSTGTDTFNIAIEMELPPNYAYRLVRANISTTAVTANTWGANNAGLAVYPTTSPEVPSGAATELRLPMDQSAVEGLGEVQSGKSWSYAINGNQGGMSCPILFGYTDNSGVWPRLTINDDTAGTQDDIVMSYWFEWLVYTLEQVNNAAVHWPMATTPSG